MEVVWGCLSLCVTVADDATAHTPGLVRPSRLTTPPTTNTTRLLMCIHTCTHTKQQTPALTPMAAATTPPPPLPTAGGAL